MRQTVVKSVGCGEAVACFSDHSASYALLSEGSEQHELKKKPRLEQRGATCPTYEAGLPACTQGAVGGVVAGLRVGGEVKLSNTSSKELQSTHGKKGGKKDGMRAGDECWRRAAC